MKLEELIAEVIGVDVEILQDNSGPDNLENWDSMAQISLIEAIEETYSVKFTITEIEKMKDVAAIRNQLKIQGKAV